jgi:hypothetical protein
MTRSGNKKKTKRETKGRVMVVLVGVFVGSVGKRRGGCLAE